MSTTRDWMRGGEGPERPEPKARPLKGVLIWVAGIALATYVALAILHIIG
jgi:hypothetical protein